ncbi:hypothetical protein L916_19337 [Phytophthora nicotianae]|uniref:Peptidase S74 domain-containing protein n=2 Tax=Phytophthora nicotianae TaxID=4792 RepID=W2HYP5_PHYNI|nr:hypothetical protein L916_19337 [Phytophthora nicotianae]
MEQGVRGSANASNPNCYFWRFANSDRLLMDSSGNIAIGGSINTSYKVNINGAINANSLYVNGSLADLSKLPLLSATPGIATASKALITDSANALSDLNVLTIKGSNSGKSLIVQNDVATSAASMNFVSYFQAEVGVRGSSHATTPNCFFIRFGNGDRLLMDSTGNIAIGGSVVNSSYKMDVSGTFNCTTLSIGGTVADLSKLPLLSATPGIASPSKALITDSVNALSDLNVLTIKGSSSGKSLIVQNDVTTSAASMNFVSYFQCEVGVRGSSHATTPNCFFIRFGNGDRVLMDSTGNIAIGGSVNSSYKLDVNGALNCTSLTVAGSAITAASNVYSVTAGTTLSASNACDKYNLILRNGSTSSSTVNGIAFLSETDTAYSSVTPSAAIIASRVSSSTYAASALAFYTKFSSNASQTGSLSRRLYIDETSVSIGNTNGTGDFNILTGSPTILIGSGTGAYNNYQIGFSYAGSGSASNNLILKPQSAATNTLTLTGNQRVAIGLTDPASKFHVTGTSDNLYGSWIRTLEFWNDNSTPMKAGVIMYNEAGGSSNNGIAIGTYTNDPINFMVNGSTGMLFNTSKRLAVNRVSPEATIHSGGAVWADDAFHCKSNAANMAYYRWNWLQSNYPAIGNHVNSSTIRIGICDASYAWTGYAPVYGGAYTNGSDARIKKDITDCPYGLSTVLSMKPCKYTMIQDDSIHIGFIAQELKQVCPIPVSGDPNSPLHPETGLPPDPMGIDLSSLTAVLCKAIQEQNAMITALQTQIQDAIARIGILERKTKLMPVL